VEHEYKAGEGESLPYRFTGKELDGETGFYYYGARYLDPKTSRWISGDPAMGEYIPGAPVNEAARSRNGNLPGMGGVFNLVNLHVYHYAGNNPLKYTDPDGRMQNILQLGVMLELAGFSRSSETARQQVMQNTEIIITRGGREGVEVNGVTYYQDNLSIRVNGVEINSIQVQSTVDNSKYSESDASADNVTYKAKIGVSGYSNPLIKDTLQIDSDNFMHGPSRDRGKPGSGGCVVTETKTDEREVMNILRNQLGFKNGETVNVRFEQDHKDL
jgi:RHS repeat-associated protein